MEISPISALHQLKIKNRTPKGVSKERVNYLWKRVRNAARTIGKLSKMSKDIQLLGSSKNTYIEKQSKETSAEIESEPKKMKLFILRPKSNFLKYWSVVMLLLLLYTVSVTPFLVCFEDNLSDIFKYMGFIIDLLFCFDILINLSLAFVNDEGILIEDRGIIAKRYLRSWFLVDFISSIPFDYIEQLYIKNSYNRLFRLLRLPRLYKLFKVFRIKRIIQVFKRYAIIKKILRILRDHAGIVNLIKFTFTVLIVVHLLGCLWFFTAKYNDFNSDTWVFRYNYVNSDMVTLYITSIYFVFTTLTTVGYGDIVAFTKEERIFALIIMSFGVAFYSYTISNLSTIIASIDSKSLNMKARISALNEFAKATKLPEDLKQRIKSHILLNYEENIFSWFDQDSLMNELPASIREQVSKHMHYKIVDKVYFFQDKDPSFISYMIPKLRNICLQGGDYLYKEHEYPDEVYFLTKGRINLVAGNGVAFKTYVQGSYFGEVELLENKPRTCTVQVHKEGAEFLVLSKKHFFKLMEEFPKIAEEIKETARLRRIKNNEAKELALNPHCLIRSETKIKTFYATNTTEYKIEPNERVLERSKTKFPSPTREKNRKMWQNLIKEKKNEESKNKPIENKGKSKWDGMLKNIFGKKDSMRPTESNQQTLVTKKSGIFEKALSLNPVITSKSSKWNIVRSKYSQILEMSKENKEYLNLLVDAGNFTIPEKVDWLLDDLEINSPLGSDSEKKSDPKLSLLKALNSHLGQHNLRMQYKINLARRTFSMLKSRQDYIKSQIEEMLTIATSH